MKKMLCVFAVALFAVVLTGCGKSDTLKCSMEQYGMKVETTFTFDGDKITKYAMSMDLGSKDLAKTYADGLEDEDDVKVTVDGSKIVMTYTGDAIEDEAPEGSKKEVKELLESQGFTCK